MYIYILVIMLLSSISLFSMEVTALSEIESDCATILQKVDQSSLSTIWRERVSLIDGITKIRNKIKLLTDAQKITLNEDTELNLKVNGVGEILEKHLQQALMHENAFLTLQSQRLNQALMHEREQARMDKQRRHSRDIVLLDYIIGFACIAWILRTYGMPTKHIERGEIKDDNQVMQ